jgi:hypothetical protein
MINVADTSNATVTAAAVGKGESEVVQAGQIDADNAQSLC